jgi:hypothetical protein
MIAGQNNLKNIQEKTSKIMAKVDIDAIRKRLEQINGGGNRGGSNNKFPRWKYEKPGTYHLRVLPFPDADPGMPFPERIVYYGISGTNGGMIVSPENVGGKDPIKDFRIGLYNQAKEEHPQQAEQTKKQAALLKEKTINCVAIVDRADEASGAQLWSPNYTDVKQLIGLFMTDAGDYTDLEEGCDITLVVTAGKKVVQTGKRKGEAVLEATITADRKNSPAHKDPEVVKGWMANLPKIDEYYPVTSTEETAKRLQEWLDAGDHSKDSDGLARGGKPAEVKEDAPKAADKPASTKAAASPPKPPAAKKSLLTSVEDNIDRELDDLANDE